MPGPPLSVLLCRDFVQQLARHKKRSIFEGLIWLRELEPPIWPAPLRRYGVRHSGDRFAYTSAAGGGNAYRPLGDRALLRLLRGGTIICLAWPRPFLVAAALIPSAALLEALQCLEPGHSPNIFAALSSIGGVLVGALLATLLLRVRTLQIEPQKRELDSERE